MGRTHKLMDPALVQAGEAEATLVAKAAALVEDVRSTLASRSAAAGSHTSAENRLIVPQGANPWWLPREYTSEELGIDDENEGYENE